MRKLLIAVIVAFILLSCDTEPMSNKDLLIGTWKKSSDTYIETFEFSDTAVKSTYTSIEPPVESVIINGIYECYETVIIFRMENGMKFFTDYSISGNELTMTFSHTGNTVIYIK
ncbi:MAG: hypothetical protein FWB86_13345 [Treponema sp.]|nr:hypothetical protein [Treponema sp.]